MRILELVLPVILTGTYVQCCGQQKQQQQRQRPVILDRTDTTGEHMINTNPCLETSDFRTRKPGEKLPVCTGAGQATTPVGTVGGGLIMLPKAGQPTPSNVKMADDRTGTLSIQRDNGTTIISVSPSGDLLIFNDTPEKDPPTLVRKQLESKQKASKKEK